MSLPDKCPTCLRADRSSPASIRQQLERDVETWQAEATRLAARVAELEARVRDAEESNANALARLSAAEATIELKHAENQAARSQLWLIETACDALEKRFAEMEALAKEAREDEAWANERTVLVEFSPVTAGWYASVSDGVHGISATAQTIHGALRLLRGEDGGKAMSLFTKTCPHCDAGPGPYVNSYLCGTYLRAGVDNRKHQTKRCVTRQMFALVERTRKAEARVKRLEEALENVINAGKPNQTEHPSMWKAWLKARLVLKGPEAKP